MKEEALRRLELGEFVICNAVFEKRKPKYELFVIMKTDTKEVMEEAWRYVKCHFGVPKRISYNLSPEGTKQKKIARLLIKAGRFVL